MNWKQLKDSVYYLDGSLRDLYILNATKNDWVVWADFVNRNYKIQFYNSDNEVIDNKVDLTGILNSWEVNDHSGFSATVFLDNIMVQSYFFTDEEIENDISPAEINSMEDHLKLVNYMIGLSTALNKKIVLSPESESETELIVVYKDKVIVNL